MGVRLRYFCCSAIFQNRLLRAEWRGVALMLYLFLLLIYVLSYTATSTYRDSLLKAERSVKMPFHDFYDMWSNNHSASAFRTLWILSWHHFLLMASEILAEGSRMSQLMVFKCNRQNLASLKSCLWILNKFYHFLVFWSHRGFVPQYVLSE